MYGFYEKGLIFRSAFDDGEVATALAYNNAIGDEESTWMMIEPTLITRFSIQAITAFTVTTEPVVGLFRKPVCGVSNIGTDDSSTNAAFMTNSGASYTVNEFVGWTIYNITDGSSGVITANTATTITATLSGGTDNDWDTSDEYVIGYRLAQISIPTGTAIGDVIYCNVANVPNIAGTGLTATGVNNYKTRGPAELYAGEQLTVVSTTLGVGSAGTFQPYAIGHPMAEVAANQSKMTASA